MTVCFAKGATVLIALRLLPSPLNTIAGARFADATDDLVRAERALALLLSPPLLHAVAASAITAPRTSIRRTMNDLLLFDPRDALIGGEVAG